MSNLNKNQKKIFKSNLWLSFEQLSLLNKAEDKKFNKDYKWAIEILNEVLYDDPWCVPALEELSDNQLSLWENEKALNTAKFILSLDNKSYTANYLAWFISSRINNHKDGVKYLWAANKLRPNNPEVLRCYWWSLFMSGETWKWIALLERARNLFSNDTQILNDLAVCMIETWNVEKWIDLLSEIQDIDPWNKRAEHTLMFLEKNSDVVNKIIEKKSKINK